MKYTIRRTTQFKRSFKLAVKRGKNPELLRNALTILSTQGSLPKEYLPPLLKGSYNGIWECHLEPDWLMLWKQNDKELILLLMETGTHSDLFKK